MQELVVIEKDVLEKLIFRVVDKAIQNLMDANNNTGKFSVVDSSDENVFDPNNHYTTKEVAILFNKTVRCIYNWCKDGTLTKRKYKRELYFIKEEVHSLFNQKL
ncbi:helix-turn-helix domain-containing protein [Empedobacter sp. GD03739]|uniref:helix-turn-helix domain-containing protein n=1 Tax=Empedobacter sp. GD03739 TaxID=2975376 RepID=UPI00244C3EBE|nr:helix-turn-helix domain-containing protein [Empedobacter sp. GD03739]MDH1603410.1 helix-turn-helix domain-containing protein [Empedobacter sp. GD03739]